jgi:MFS family permease
MDTLTTPVRRTWDLYSSRQRWTYLAVLFLVSTSNYADRNVISVLLEPIKAEFHVSDTMLGLLTGISFAVFYATLGIPVARWADRGNRKFIMTLALTVWSFMTMLCGAAQTFWQLAFARVGVGAGEAGAIPPAQSLIADYFDPTRRARALAIFMASATAGYLLGFVLGAHIAAVYGWRHAFLLLGAPGLLLALIVHFVLREPRLLAEFRPEVAAGESTSETIRALLRKRSFLYLIAGMVVYFMIAYGALVFFPSYMVRVLHQSLDDVGAVYGGLSAVTTVFGTLAGGWVTDRLGRVNVAWLGWLPALGLVLAWPFYELLLLVPSFGALLVISVFAGLALNLAIPAMFAALHAICGSARRAMAVAICFFFANLIGLGLGPVIAGALSDAFTAAYGPVGLRYSLMIVVTLLLPSGLFMYLCGRHIARDSEA